MRNFTLSFIFTLFCFTGIAQNIAFSFDDVRLNPTDSTLSFAVMMAATTSGTFHTGGNCYLTYDPVAFGTNAAANGQVTVSPALNGLTPASYSFNVNDVFGGTTLNIDWTNLSLLFGFPVGYVEVSTLPDTLFRVSMKYLNPKADLRVAFDSANTDGKIIWFDNVNLSSIATYTAPHSYGPDIFFPASTIAEKQQVSLSRGWNLVSTYLCLNEWDMDSIFQDISSAVWIVKDDIGNAYLPGLVNTIGTWQQNKGYWVKTYRDTVLEFAGQPLLAAQRVLNLPTGWSLIAYLRDSALAVAPALGPSVLNNMYALKDQQGGIFLPSFGINQVGMMQAGQGYWINMLNPDTLLYPARMAFHEAPALSPILQPTHFSLPKTSLENATLIFPASSWEGVLANGDEVAILDPRGQTVGAGVYQGQNLAVAIWGDEAETSEIEGLLPGESLRILRWDGRVETEIAAGEVAYSPHDITLLTPSRKAQLPKEARIKCFPNPARDWINLEVEADFIETLSFQLFDIRGSKLWEKRLQPTETVQRWRFSLTEFPPGLYTYRLIGDQTVWQGKLLLGHQ